MGAEQQPRYGLCPGEDRVPRICPRLVFGWVTVTPVHSLQSRVSLYPRQDKTHPTHLEWQLCFQEPWGVYNCRTREWWNANPLPHALLIPPKLHLVPSEAALHFRRALSQTLRKAELGGIDKEPGLTLGKVAIPCHPQRETAALAHLWGPPLTSSL